MIQWFKLRKPKDLREQFVGDRLTVYPTAKDAWQRTNGVKVIVDDIRGNMTHQTMFEVNGAYLVSMLDAYSEINREPLPNREMHEGFLSTVATNVMETRKPSLIEKVPYVQS